VVSLDSLTGMSDTYATVDVHGCRAQRTDVHWRAKKGKASWNYRLKFDVELGVNTASYKFPYLKLQLWDKNVAYDDMMAEHILDLKDHFQKALRNSLLDEKRLQVIKVYEDPPKMSKSTGPGFFGGGGDDDDSVPLSKLLTGDLHDGGEKRPPLPEDGSPAYDDLFEPVASELAGLAEAADDVVDAARGDKVGSGGGGFGATAASVLGRRRRKGRSKRGQRGQRPSHAGGGEDNGVEITTMDRDLNRSSSDDDFNDEEGGSDLSVGDKCCWNNAPPAGNDGEGSDGENNGALLVDGDSSAAAPKRRRRRKKQGPAPGSSCGCFCCLRCVCRACCVVMTCSCFAPADEPATVAGGADDGNDGHGNGGDNGQGPKESCLKRWCPSCVGRGLCERKAPVCARLLQCICRLLAVGRVLVLFALRLLLAAACCCGRCVVTFFTETLVALCPACCWCCALCKPGKKAGGDDDEFEDIPDGEEGEDEADLEAEAEEAKLLSNQLASLVGRGPDPPDSKWLFLDREHPKRAGEREPMGKLCVSVEILGADAAKASPAGAARSAPNQNPRVPPPTGRLKWSWNPFVMGAQLCGPKLCCYFTCFLLTGVFIVLSIYCQPVMNVIMWILVNIFIPG